MDNVKICIELYKKEKEFFALKHILKEALGHFWGYIYIIHLYLRALSPQLSEISCKSSQEIVGTSQRTFS